ncbi:aldo/keto reductase [Shewanella submarina]|uniref:Aldo/keto reductase family oxidoreductase n=1 Tax=Shewanella submarina TaxID=2016376 RepID=A0ABV7G6C6_9GAMM|nr:aldo/keto reductase [Shewanella submarina]MCL1039372.1 aldo/keto reductase [Shewanella submarina]
MEQDKSVGDEPLALSEFIQGYWRLAQWQMTPQQRLTFIEQHLELGISSIDQADIYGGYTSETLLGEALKLKPSIRQQLQIITKCGIKLVSENGPGCQVNHYDSGRDHILKSVDDSLTRMGLERIDLLLIHRPDFLMDADEIAGAFSLLKSAGKVRHFGVSNFTSSQFSLLQSRLDEPLATNQVEINPFNFAVTEDGTLDLCQQLRVRPMAWSCLAGGRLLTDNSDKANRLRAELQAIAEELNADSVEQVVFAWIRMLPSRPRPILGSGNIARVKEAVGALQLHMSREQWYRVWIAAKGHGVP